MLRLRWFSGVLFAMAVAAAWNTFLQCWSDVGYHFRRSVDPEFDRQERGAERELDADLIDHGAGAFDGADTGGNF